MRKPLYVLVLISSLFGCSKTKVELEGVITSSNTGKPLENVTITVVEGKFSDRVSYSYLGSTKTDSEGYFYFEAKVEKPCGSIEVRANAEGYSTFDNQNFVPLDCEKGLQTVNYSLDSCYKMNFATGLYENTGAAGCE